MTRTRFGETAWAFEPEEVERIRDQVATDFRDEDDEILREAEVGETRLLLAEIDRLHALLLAHQQPVPAETGENDSEGERLERIHRSLATGYLAGLLHGDPRIRFVELDPERTVVRFAELLPHPDFTIRITPDLDVPF